MLFLLSGIPQNVPMMNHSLTEFLRELKNLTKLKLIAIVDIITGQMLEIHLFIACII